VGRAVFKACRMIDVSKELIPTLDCRRTRRQELSAEVGARSRPPASNHNEWNFRVLDMKMPKAV
jgi:hypothetical protein